MKRHPILWAWLALAFLALGGVIGLALDNVSRPCEFEDSSWCTWYADVQGNGQGESFTSTWDGGPVVYGWIR